MFLMKAIQDKYLLDAEKDKESIAFVIFNVKGRDLLAIEEKNENIEDSDIELYKMLELKTGAFKNVTQIQQQSFLGLLNLGYNRNRLSFQLSFNFTRQKQNKKSVSQIEGSYTGITLIQ